jgi:hypothetical protein
LPPFTSRPLGYATVSLYFSLLKFPKPSSNRKYLTSSKDFADDLESVVRRRSHCKRNRSGLQERQMLRRSDRPLSLFWSNSGEPPQIDFNLVGDNFVQDKSVRFFCFHKGR